MTNGDILYKVGIIHIIAILLLVALGFSSGYPILSIGEILTAICAPLVTYGYIYMRIELRNNKPVDSKKVKHFLWSLYLWIGAFIILLVLYFFFQMFDDDELKSLMIPLNAAKIFFFSWYIPIFFPEPKEENNGS